MESLVSQKELLVLREISQYLTNSLFLLLLSILASIVVKLKKKRF